MFYDVTQESFLAVAAFTGEGKPETLELGIWIKTEAHGNGYGKEAIIGLKRWADSNLAYKFLTYPVDRRNHASLRIPEALGGEVFGREAQKKVDGTTLELLVYRIFPQSGCNRRFLVAPKSGWHIQ